MPRYYFRLTNGNQDLNNHKGIDLAGIAAPRADAIALARDLKNDEKMPGWNWTGSKNSQSKMPSLASILDTAWVAALFRSLCLHRRRRGGC